MDRSTWRRWYKGKQWRRIRLQRLRAEPLCRMCKAEGRVEPASVVDHIRPHKGDRALFFDYENTQPLCKAHHDRDKQSIERVGFDKRIGLDGWPVDPMHPSNRGFIPSGGK